MAHQNGNDKPKPLIDFKEIAAEKNAEKEVANTENLGDNQTQKEA